MKSNGLAGQIRHYFMEEKSSALLLLLLKVSLDGSYSGKHCKPKREWHFGTVTQHSCAVNSVSHCGEEVDYLDEVVGITRELFYPLLEVG